MKKTGCKVPEILYDIDEEQAFKPLVYFYGEAKARNFMFMGVILQEGLKVYMYKNCDTRRYLNLDEQGNTYMYCADGIYRLYNKDAAWQHAIS